MRVTAERCPACGSVNDGATEVRDGNVVDTIAPRAGDCLVCVYCVTPLVWDNRLGMRLPTSDELRLIATIPDVQRTIVAASLARAERIREAKT